MRFYVLIFLLFSYAGSQAQHYHTAAGLRFGNEIGLTVQQRIAPKFTLEGMGYKKVNSPDKWGVALLAERHVALVGNRINGYFGAGGHYVWRTDSSTVNPAGITAIVGAELTIKEFCFSVDFKPAYHLLGQHPTTLETAFALSARYILVRQPRFQFFKRLFS